MKRKRTSLSISARRHFIDSFFFANSRFIANDAQIIDIGGKKKHKRGLFDVDKYGAKVTYVNIDKSTEPDILASAIGIPLPDQSFDVAIMGELLEHVPDPRAVLKESYRLLKPGGIALVTVPFNVGVHGDPYDYGRYTSALLEKMAQEAGFRETRIEQHGNILSVMALMIQHIFLAKNCSWRPIQFPLVRFLMWLDKRVENPLLTSWTTGYGLVLTK